MEITTTGVHYGQQLPPGIPVIIELAGTYGGTTATIGFKDADATFAAYRLPGTATAVTQSATGLFGPVYVPSSGFVGVSLAGGAPDVILKVTPVREVLARG